MSALSSILSKTGWAKPQNLDVPSFSWAAFKSRIPAQTGKLRLEMDGIDDEGWVFVNGHLVGETHQWDTPLNLDPGDLTQRSEIVVIVHNVAASGGITGTPRLTSPGSVASHKLPFNWTDEFVGVGKVESYALATGELQRIRKGSTGRPAAGTNGPLCRSTLTFDLPDTLSHPWEIILNAGGNGFLSLNGHALGRYWEVGPQRAFYLPACWLKPQGNILELTVRPGASGDRITAAQIHSLPRS